MNTLWILLTALIPVLFIGASLAELLLLAAPRRGKRPDCHELAFLPLRRVRVVTLDNRAFTGTLRQSVYFLRRLGYGPIPFWLTSREAERLLRLWETQGQLLVQGEWD